VGAFQLTFYCCGVLTGSAIGCSSSPLVPLFNQSKPQIENKSSSNIYRNLLKQITLIDRLPKKFLYFFLKVQLKISLNPKFPNFRVTR
jgi:hypothetical protein